MKNKDKIAQAAFLLSLKYGFDNVSIKQIQEEANVTTGAIYYHFKDKNDILDYILKKICV
ncbi:TetR/AcrR family transcriptional regulator [Methanobrevibacter arboriphilus]|uniref:TetR/AcrR family transcriptional regulator n=1 Tax=Methanobrevibacter arboriphilus TaxID=39441 RepID=UPI000AF6EEEF|nr:TetR/AcrR family transcriptional regulator [Methanobrevibacter arboriphilus]